MIGMAHDLELDLDSARVDAWTHWATLCDAILAYREPLPPPLSR